VTQTEIHGEKRHAPDLRQDFRITAPAVRWSCVKPNCRKIELPFIPLSSNASLDTSQSVLIVRERFQFRFQPIVDRQIHGTLVAGAINRQRDAIKALL
jgi:hypothetical protein